jgi:hypothetical protein
MRLPPRTSVPPLWRGFFVAAGLKFRQECSLSVPMVVGTLGQAWRLRWRVKAGCLRFAPAPKSRHDRKLVACDTAVERDTATLVWTRGDRLPTVIYLADTILRPCSAEF